MLVVAVVVVFVDDNVVVVDDGRGISALVEGLCPFTVVVEEAVLLTPGLGL